MGFVTMGSLTFKPAGAGRGDRFQMNQPRGLHLCRACSYMCVGCYSYGIRNEHSARVESWRWTRVHLARQ